MIYKDRLAQVSVTLYQKLLGGTVELKATSLHFFDIQYKILTLTSIQADYNSRVHGGGLLKKAT
jgi:hypothetical protein